MIERSHDDQHDRGEFDGKCQRKRPEPVQNDNDKQRTENEWAQETGNPGNEAVTGNALARVRVLQEPQ